MPEGDTLRRAEALLSPVLDGRVVTDIWFRKLRGHRPRVGQTVERVNAVGKHLLIDFDRRLTLRTHLGMSGSWRTTPPGTSAPRSPRLRIVISTDAGTALCFAAPTIDTFIRGGDSSPIDHLGPDLSDDDVDFDVVVKRTREFADQSLLAEALLDQRVASGVGNVFKSEVAFLAGVHPFTPVANLSDEALARIWRIANQQLTGNRDRSSRKTTGRGVSGRNYVYDRFRYACRRCSDSVLFSPAGRVTERSTYWCPRCQPGSELGGPQTQSS
ncbi:MAG: DNA-formamidopyrimidine glycosylase family protein [Acidimicrobiales bacterium]